MTTNRIEAELIVEDSHGLYACRGAWSILSITTFLKTIDQITLGELNKLSDEIIDFDALKRAGLISSAIKRVKIILSGELTKPLQIKGLLTTKGAKKAIEDLGGHVED